MIAQSSVVIIAICLVAGTQQAAVKLADLITPCSVKDPKLNECLLTLGRKLLPVVVKGVKEWGVIPLDPLMIPFMQLQNSDGGSVGLSISMTNSSHYGRDSLQLTSVKVDLKTLEFEVATFMPKYSVLGTYDASGRILLLPISGHGSANMTFLDVDVKCTFQGKLEVKGTKTYMKLIKFKNAFNVGKLYVNFENLFGNKQLSDTMNSFVNDNSKEVFADLKATNEKLMTGIDRTIISRLLAKVPVTQLIRDIKA